MLKPKECGQANPLICKGKVYVSAEMQKDIQNNYKESKFFTGKKIKFLG